MPRSAGLLERRNLVIERLPAPAKNVRPRDDHVDFVCPRFDRSPNLRDALRQRRQARQEIQSKPPLHEYRCLPARPAPSRQSVINANRRDFDPQLFNPQLVLDLRLNRMPRFRAQPPHPLVGVVARKRSQIHAGDRPQKPCRLPFFFHRAPRRLRLGAPLDRTGIDAHRAHPIEIQTECQRSAAAAGYSERQAPRHSKRHGDSRHSRSGYRSSRLPSKQPMQHTSAGSARSHQDAGNCTAAKPIAAFFRPAFPRDKNPHFRPICFLCLGQVDFKTFSERSAFLQGAVMFTPQSLSVALFMMIVSAVCWGSWPILIRRQDYRFELFTRTMPSVFF